MYSMRSTLNIFFFRLVYEFNGPDCLNKVSAKSKIPKSGHLEAFSAILLSKMHFFRAKLAE